MERKLPKRVRQATARLDGRKISDQRVQVHDDLFHKSWNQQNTEQEQTRQWYFGGGPQTVAGTGTESSSRVEVK